MFFVSEIGKFNGTRVCHHRVVLFLCLEIELFSSPCAFVNVKFGCRLVSGRIKREPAGVGDKVQVHLEFFFTIPSLSIKEVMGSTR